GGNLSSARPSWPEPVTRCGSGTGSCTLPPSDRMGVPACTRWFQSWSAAKSSWLWPMNPLNGAIWAGILDACYMLFRVLATTNSPCVAWPGKGPTPRPAVRTAAGHSIHDDDHIIGFDIEAADLGWWEYVGQPGTFSVRTRWTAQDGLRQLPGLRVT